MPTDAFHKLIPMTAFVIEYYSNEGYADLQTLNMMKNYANFLKKPLTLGMFIPVDSHGTLLKEPKNYASWNALKHNREAVPNENESMLFEEYKRFQKAEKKCLFKGFTMEYNGYSLIRIAASYNRAIELTFNTNDLKCKNFEDIESLTVLNDIYLDTAALKIIGIKN
ncbi:hypothetical protein ODZ84_00490 [Chryseobacterium fluminis]|uniref:hypothetical protein n=1 Tax=Chryseobacterium fluminis TaxID=2983606 RepID=UPI0022535CEE|nr:hypothetical protein [Chryseobacterium sp. MMS21-Ot14]UZT98082.1 hypothetical protein ODZ84_00490 [Chryseobacterium sp. MMS21-Ot14]